MNRQIILKDFSGGYAMGTSDGRTIGLYAPGTLGTGQIFTYNPITGLIMHVATNLVLTSDQGATNTSPLVLKANSAVFQPNQQFNYDQTSGMFTLRAAPTYAISIHENQQTSTGGAVWMYALVGTTGNENQHWQFA